MAIADVYQDISLSYKPSITRLIESVHRDQTRAIRHLPAWDLIIGMQFLLRPPFAPLSMALHTHLTLKTVFLLALDSGLRQSEIHTWVIDGIKFSHKFETVYFASPLEFIAKKTASPSGPFNVHTSSGTSLSHQSQRTIRL